MRQPPKLFGFCRVGQPSLRVGSSPEQPIEFAPPAVPAPAPMRFYAVSVPLKGGAPRVFDYPNTADGRAELASLTRGERVIDVLFGYRVTVERASVIEFECNGDHVVDRINVE